MASKLLEEYPQIITVFSAYIVAGAFLYKEINNPDLKTLGAVFIYAGLLGIFIIVSEIYVSKLKETLEGEKASIVDAALAVLLITAFAYLTLSLPNMIKSDPYFVSGVILSSIMIVFALVLIFAASQIIRRRKV